LLYFTILSIIAFGPFGLAGSALTVFLRSLFARHARPFAEWYVSLFPQHTTNKLQSLHDMLVMRRGGLTDPTSLASLFDLLASGSVSQKQAALSLIADHFHPSFTPALHSALSDPEPVIRVLSATAVARLEAEFATKWKNLSHRLELHPRDEDLRLAAAEHLATYAGSGLLDAARAHEMWQNALALLEKGGAIDKRDSRFAELASRILLGLGRPEEAVNLLQPLINRRTPSCEMLLGLSESLFALGRFDELRQVCRQYKPYMVANNLPVKAREAVHLWSADQRVVQ